MINLPYFGILSENLTHHTFSDNVYLKFLAFFKVSKTPKITLTPAISLETTNLFPFPVMYWPYSSTFFHYHL